VATPVLQFDIQARGIAAEVVVVELAHQRQAAAHTPTAIVIGVDRSGLLPAVSDAEFDLLLTPATPPSRSWIHVAAEQMETTLVHLSAAVSRVGLPAAVLAQVLRIGKDLAAPDALLLESFAYSTLLGGQSFRHWLGTRTRRALAAPGTRVHCARDGATLSITLANPSRRNAIDVLMRDELVEALTAANDDPTVTAVTLRAAGSDFSSGGDLAEFGSAQDLTLAHAVRSLRSPAGLLTSLATRATAYVHGACVGAGIEIPAAAGRVVATADAQFWLPELAMGLIPGAGGTVTIARRIGRQRLLRWALSGDRIDAATALAWGLVDAIERVA
jgi:hypothetical protein